MIKRAHVEEESDPAADEAQLTNFVRQLGDGSGEAAAVTELDVETDDPGQPFEPVFGVPLDVARRAAQPETASQFARFFYRHYFGTEPWRRIDHEWMGTAAELALKLDNATNNGSLVLAIELEQGEVLLFAADAQAGSWLSWQDLAWTVGDGDQKSRVTGPDLLKRVVFYKVGHHGSSNATPREQGLEQMTSGDVVAFIPVDAKAAADRGWGRMPLSGLVQDLEKLTGGRVIRTDQDYPGSGSWLEQTPLYYDFLLP
jgi:hypothetical protein